MSAFSATVESFWQRPHAAGQVLCASDRLRVSVNPDLGEDRRVMVLDTAGQLRVVVTPAVAGLLGWSAPSAMTEATLRRQLAEAGLRLHGADWVFHYTEEAKTRLLLETDAAGVRPLTADDGEVFAAFQAAASAQDLDDAYVELEHWAVFGAFEQGRLVAAASMYPWDEGPAALPIADTGVLSLPPCRGRGHARALVRAISREACRRGHEPQYRCQTDNLASVALARSAGLSVYGKWEVVSAETGG